MGINDEYMRREAQREADRKAEQDAMDREMMSHERHLVHLGLQITVVVSCILLLFIVFFKLVGPQLNLYKANTEKRAQIAEAKAESEAAEYKAKSRVTQAKSEAEAELERAKGLALAQAEIASTLTDEYLEYLYIQALTEAGAEVIYIPTEAGIPVTEAGRMRDVETNLTVPE